MRNSILLTIALLGSIVPFAAAAPPTTFATRVIQPEITSPAFWLQRAEKEFQSLSNVDRYEGFAALAKNYGAAGDKPRFEYVIRRLREVELSIGDTRERSVVSMTLAPAFARVGDEASMRAAIAAALEDSRQAGSSNYSLVRSLSDLGQFAEASKLAMDADANSRPDRLGYLAAAQAKAGLKDDYEATMRLAEAQTNMLARATKAPDDQYYLFNGLANYQISAGDFARAAASADALPADHGAVLHAMIARQFLTSGDRAGYARSIDRAIELAGRAQSPVYTHSAYGEIAAALVRAHDDDRLRITLEKSENARGKLDSNALFEQALIHAEAGEVMEAQTALNKATAAVANDDDVAKAMRFTQVRQWQVMQALAHAGKDDAALEMAGHAVLKDKGADATQPEQIFPLIAAVQAAGGRLSAARTTMERIPDRALRESLSMRVARAAGQSGDALADMARWIDGFAQPKIRAAASMAVAEGLILHAEKPTPTRGNGG